MKTQVETGAGDKEGKGVKLNNYKYSMKPWRQLTTLTIIMYGHKRNPKTKSERTHQTDNKPK